MGELTIGDRCSPPARTARFAILAVLVAGERGHRAGRIRRLPAAARRWNVTERRRISSGSPWEPKIGISRAVRVGDRVVVSGTAPIWPDGSCDPDPEIQAQRCLEIIVAALREAGAAPANVVPDK